MPQRADVPFSVFSKSILQDRFSVVFYRGVLSAFEGVNKIVFLLLYCKQIPVSFSTNSVGGNGLLLPAGFPGRRRYKGRLYRASHAREVPVLPGCRSRFSACALRRHDAGDAAVFPPDDA